jgi:hypothetical protein
MKTSEVHLAQHKVARITGGLYLWRGWPTCSSASRTGFVTAQLFFGAWLFPLGYLVYRSGSIPRLLGVLLVLDGVGVLVWFLQALLLPDYRAIAYPGLAVSFVAEVGLGLWLLVVGVKVVDTGAGPAGDGRDAGLTAAETRP